jgi:hypothetical protein
MGLATWDNFSSTCRTFKMVSDDRTWENNLCTRFREKDTCA